MALADNLVSYWKLDESSGNAADAVGANTLTNTNAVGYATGKINNGADFGAANTNKDFRAASACGTTYQNQSFSLWVKLRTEISTGAYGFFIFRTTSGGTNYIDWSLQYEYNGGTRRLSFNRSKPGVADQPVTSNVTLGTTSWHHIVGTYDTSTLSLYLDGALLNSISASGVGSAGANSTTVGSANGSNYASVFMDEVGIWSRTLLSTEVTSLFNGGAGLSHPFSLPTVSLTTRKSLLGVGL